MRPLLQTFWRICFSIQTYSYRTIKLEITLSICYAINLCMWYSISHWVLSVLKTIQIMRYAGNIRFETNMIDIDPSIFEINTCIRIYFDVLVGKFTFSKSYGRLKCSQRVVQCSYSKSNLQILPIVRVAFVDTSTWCKAFKVNLVHQKCCLLSWWSSTVFIKIKCCIESVGNNRTRFMPFSYQKYIYVNDPVLCV